MDITELIYKAAIKSYRNSPQEMQQLKFLGIYFDRFYSTN